MIQSCSQLLLLSCVLKERMKRRLRRFTNIVDVFATLRSKNDCMLDREQTHESLVKHLFS